MLLSGKRDGLVEEDGLALHVLLLCDHCLLADPVGDLVPELALDHELADDVGIELEGGHGSGGGGGTEVELMGGALLLGAHRKEGIADVDALQGDWQGRGRERERLTGASPKVKESGGWFGKVSRASSVSADMRTIMARLGLDWTAFEWTWSERADSGSGMVDETEKEAVTAIEWSHTI